MTVMIGCQDPNTREVQEVFVLIHFMENMVGIIRVRVKLAVMYVLGVVNQATGLRNVE